MIAARCSKGESSTCRMRRPGRLGSAASAGSVSRRYATAIPFWPRHWSDRNDRGPVLEGRIVDLSYAAARSLGLGGVGRVSLETVRDSDPVLAKALVAQVQFPVLPAPRAY